MKPMQRRHVAFGDGDKTGQPRFGGEQIVIARIQFLFGDEISDGKNLFNRIAEKAKAHVLHELMSVARERGESAVERGRS